MAIHFQCDCGVQLKAEERLGGKVIRCPDCGDEALVPRVGEDPSSYSVSGTSQGDEGWAVSQAEIERSKPNWKSESTFRPAVAKETPKLPSTVQARTKKKQSGNVVASWGESFFFPFRGANVFSFIGWVIGFMLVSLMMSVPMFFFLAAACRWVLFIFAASYFYHFLSQVVRSAAGGDDRLPEAEVGEEIFFDAIRWWVCVLLGTAPWWGLNFYYYIDQFHMHDPVGASPVISRGLLVLGILYTPMALLATTLFNTVLAANPVYVLGAIFKIPLQYLATCLLMVGVLFVYSLMEIWLPNILIVTNVLTSILFLYTSIVIMHLLGTVYYRNRQRIGWFRGE